MSPLPPPYRRRSVRLQEYDYSQDGAYFVTICTAQRRCLLSEVVGGKLRLNSVGETVQQHWEDLPNHHKGVDLDAFVVMPNHVHGIIIFEPNDGGIDGRQAREGEAGLATTVRQDMSGLGGAGAGADGHPTREGEAGLATTGDGGVASGRRKRTLGVVVAGVKSAVSRDVRLNHKTIGASLWQAGYYEHVIRSDVALDRIREYIETNPAKWEFDHDNPANWPSR